MVHKPVSLRQDVGSFYAPVVGVEAGAAPAPPPEPDWWDPNEEGLCVWGAWKPKGAADQASSYTDLTGNGNDVTVGVAPSWNATDGWQFDGVDDYLDSGFTPQKDQSQSVLIQYTDHEDAYVCMAGVESRPGVTTHRFYWQNKANTRTTVWHTSTAVGSLVNRIAVAGNCGISFTQHYWNGVADPTIMPSSGGADDFIDTFYLGCYNNKGAGPSAFAIVYMQAVVIYDCALTAGQMLAVATEMAAL